MPSYHPRSIRGACQIILALGLLILAFSAQALTLKVGIYDQKPDVYLDANGRPGGILGELLNEIARQEGWTIQPQACHWADCMRQLRSGQIDLLPDVFYTLERAKTLSFHHVPALHSWSQIYARPGNTLRSIEDLRGQSLVVLAGTTQEDYLRDTLAGLNIPVRMHRVDTLDQGFQQVQRHQQDAVAADYFFGELAAKAYGLVATPIIFQPTQAFFATPLGQHAEVLAAIDRYLAAWQNTPGSFYYQTLDHWRSPHTHSTLGTQGAWIIAGLSGLLALALIIALWLKIQANRHHQRLQASEQRLSTILDSMDAIVCIKDSALRYVFANRKLATLLGTTEDQIIGRHDEDFHTDPDILETIRHSERIVLDTQEQCVMQQTMRWPHTTEDRTLLTIKAPLRTPGGGLDAICVIATDITERVKAEQTAHQLTFYDPLTDLPNRRTSLERLTQMIERARQHQAIGAALLIDLDKFKNINDLHGHQVGDLVLQGTAQRLSAATRDRDMVSRISADEFLVLLDGLGTNPSEAARKALHVAEKLRLALGNSAFSIQDKPAFVTASIGLTLIHAGSQSTDHAMREADMANHRAKYHGGNQVTFYEQELQSEIEQRLWLERDLLQAIDTPQLSMHIQPQFGRDGRVTGGELLARWQHPTRGAISPALFIPIAEESGLINLIGEWSLNVICDTLLALQALGETYPLSLNVSPKRLMEPQFSEYVEDILKRTGAPGNRLIFEVTEGVLIQDIQGVAQRMQMLSRMGIRFSIDDFGTGYSNLAYLKRLPLYELKIDKSLIQEVPTDIDNVAIVKLILAMADQLNLRVVAEGVETSEQSQFLFAQDCHAVQGYLMARPMPIPTWLDTVRTRHPKSPAGHP